MVRTVSIVVLLSLATLALGQVARAEGHGSEAALDPIMGEFQGTLALSGGQSVKAEAKVIADENSRYRVVVLYTESSSKNARLELDGLGANGQVAVKKGDWTGQVTKDVLTLSSSRGGKAEMKRVERSSPTLGQKPPAGAVVLLAFEPGQPGTLDNWADKRWGCEPDGVILTKGADNKSTKEFGNFKAHVEFKVPFMPAARGQGRGNSGVYLHGRYEIQVLDSFGLTTNDGECGAIYGQKAPDVNSSLPPGQWQTYDIDFKAPQFGADGKQTRGALITVVQNGVKIQDAVETKNVTGGAWGNPAKTGPLRLQFHSNPMRFRNIWVVEE